MEWQADIKGSLRPKGEKMNIDKVIEAHNKKATEAARRSIACDECGARIADCECEWRRDDQIAAAEVTRSPRHGAMVEWLAERVSGLNVALERRGLTLTRAAQLVEVERTTLYKWSTGTIKLRSSAPRLTAAQLERLMCLLVAPPPLPPIPESLRLRRSERRQTLEMCAAADCITVLEEWAKRPGVVINRTSVRLTLSGSPQLLQVMRAEILAAERWRTLTPSDADILAWIRGGGT